MRCTEELEAEHGAVLLALDVLGALAARLDSGEQVSAGDVQEVIAFLTGFVDGCHHVKEERALFPAIVAAGAPHEGGPVGLMLAQHEAGRRHVRAMRDAAASYEEGESAAGPALRDAAEAYCELLRRHIRYENGVLFPMADAMIPTEAQREILREYEAVERDVVGEGRHEAFHESLHRLHDRYAPAPT